MKRLQRSNAGVGHPVFRATLCLHACHPPFDDACQCQCLCHRSTAYFIWFIATPAGNPGVQQGKGSNETLCNEGCKWTGQSSPKQQHSCLNSLVGGVPAAGRGCRSKVPVQQSKAPSTLLSKDKVAHAAPDQMHGYLQPHLVLRKQTQPPPRQASTQKPAAASPKASAFNMILPATFRAVHHSASLVGRPRYFSAH